MSVYGNKQSGYVVRWREAGRQRSRKFDRKRDADDFDAKMRQARQRGEPVVSSTVTLSELVAEWAPRKARNLEPKTARPRKSASRVVTILSPEQIEHARDRLLAYGR